MQEQNIHWRKHWRDEGLTRIPYSLYTDTDLPEQEQERIFRGNTWNYLCLDAELAGPGSYRTTFAGTTPVVVVRDSDGEIYAFENRCAHRGALIALEKSGKAESFQCVYHAWSYNRQGDLTGVAFEKGRYVVLSEDEIPSAHPKRYNPTPSPPQKRSGFRYGYAYCNERTHPQTDQI